MKKNEIYFIGGLPRAGSTLITNILKQNQQIHAEPASLLCDILSSINYSWNYFESNKNQNDKEAKLGVLNGVVNGYYAHINKPFIVDNNIKWISQIGLLESVLQKKVKMVMCVRNPAEILSSFERIRKENPLFVSQNDSVLKDNTTIASRAYYHASPEGILGNTHQKILDAVTMGYLDRLLFVDYNRFCNTPKSQTKRIYNFFELPNFEHDYNNIEQKIYNNVSEISTIHKIKPTLEKTTVNCVEYLGLNLHEQYNSQVFWNAWI